MEEEGGGKSSSSIDGGSETEVLGKASKLIKSGLYIVIVSVLRRDAVPSLTFSSSARVGSAGSGAAAADISDDRGELVNRYR